MTLMHANMNTGGPGIIQLNLIGLNIKGLKVSFQKIYKK